MNDIIKSKYKPYCYSINNNVTIIDSSAGKFIVKKQVKELLTLFNYLDSRGFTNHPIIDYSYQNKEYIMKYVKEDFLPIEQKTLEYAKTVASLHNKTVYFKETSIDNFKEIKDIVEENINYMSSFYEGLFLNVLKKEFLSPSDYLFTRNYYKIRQALLFAKDHIDAWYDTTNKENFRVCIIHNNLTFNHFIYNENESILISWDQYRIDSPIVDLINLYKNDYENINFKSFFDEYLKRFELLENEKELLFIILAIPYPLISEDKSEINKAMQIKKLIDYVYKTEKLIRPYYAKDEKE